MHAIELRGLCRSYGSQFAIRELSLQAAPGERLVLVGKSGAGKTTLLRMIAGLEPVDAGSVWIGERDQTQAPAARRGIALVTQDAALYPQLTVRQNLMVRLKGLATAQAEQRAEQALEAFAITHLQERLPSQLSGGETQRAALAKAVASQPQILLLDEPFSQLDAVVKEPLLPLLTEAGRRHGMTVLLVSHDPFDSLRLADRIAVMEAGQVVQCDAPEVVYRRPRSRLAGDLLSPIPMNWIDSQQDMSAAWQGLWKKRAEGRRYLGFRPEAVELLPAQAADASDCTETMDLHIQAVQPLGFAKLVIGLLDGQEVRLLVDADRLPASSHAGGLPCRILPEYCGGVEV